MLNSKLEIQNPKQTQNPKSKISKIAESYNILRATEGSREAKVSVLDKLEQYSSYKVLRFSKDNILRANTVSQEAKVSVLDKLEQYSSYKVLRFSKDNILRANTVSREGRYF